MKANIIDGRAIAERIEKELLKELLFLSEKKIVPKLVTIQVGENPASSVYVKQQRNRCKKVGISYELRGFSGTLTEEEILKEVEKANLDNSVTGIILQLPLPAGIDSKKIQATISSSKDVEGVNPFNMGWVVYGKPIFVPCTAFAVMECIESVGVDLYGKEAVVVGHSNIVGKPVSLLLLEKFATVSICHIATSETGKLQEYVSRADILISAVGKPNVILGKWVKEGAIVIDVGINRVGDKLVGDVEFEEAINKASHITPVPGGVGPVTNAILLRNVVKAAKWNAI